MRPTVLMAILCVASPFAAAAQGDLALKTLAGHVTVSTSPNGRTTAVVGRNTANAQPEFLFCITHGAPVAKPIAYQGSAKLTYRPQPIPGLPPGVQISGPEPIAPMLVLAPASGAAMVFLSKGQNAPADPSLKGATTFNVAMVTRMDWAPANGPRRGTDMAGCLAPGG